MRGEAKLQTGDRDGGKADLREALKVSPGYSPAAAVLFDAYLADEEFREARQVLAVLQEHAAGPEVAVKQIQLACRTDDAEGAIRAFAEVCEGPGQSPYPVQAALTEMQTAGLEERALRVLRESWQSGGPFHPWAPIFWIDSPDGQEAEPGERLRAAEAVHQGVPEVHARARLQGRATRPRGPVRRGARRVQAGRTGRPAADRTARPGRVGRGPPRRPGEGDRDRCGSSWPRTRRSCWAGGNWPRGTTPPAGTASAWTRPSSS